MKRIYEVNIRISSFDNNAEAWDTVESMAIIDAKGYSHFSPDTRRCLSMSGHQRKVYILAANQAEAQKAVKTALGETYRQGYHVVRRFIAFSHGRRLDI